MSVYIHPSAVVDEGAQIGEGTRVWHFSHVEGNSVIGENCSIGQNAYIGKKAVIGNGCKLQNNVSVYEGVVLADYVFCGPSCVFTNDLTPRAKYPKGHENFVKTLVGKGVSIGANATIVCGHTLGEWSMIGAGAVITSNVPPHALMLGVPAKQVGYVCTCGQRLNETLCCSHCHRQFRKTGDGLSEVELDNAE